MAWYLNPALTAFRAAVNEAYPRRDEGSDGDIGDEHHKPPSDHLEDADGSVDAWDMDVELNGRLREYEDDVEHLKAVFQAHEASRYWIHDGQIATRANGWRRDPYTGANPHDRHVHWNSRQSHENSTKPWEVERMPTAEEIAAAVWAHRHKNPVTDQEQSKGTVIQYMDAVHDQKERTVLAGIARVEDRIANLPGPGTVELTDEQLERVVLKVLASINGAITEVLGETPPAGG